MDDFILMTDRRSICAVIMNVDRRSGHTRRSTSARAGLGHFHRRHTARFAGLLRDEIRQRQLQDIARAHMQRRRLRSIRIDKTVVSLSRRILESLISEIDRQNSIFAIEILRFAYRAPRGIPLARALCEDTSLR